MRLRTLTLYTFLCLACALLSAPCAYGQCPGGMCYRPAQRPAQVVYYQQQTTTYTVAPLAHVNAARARAGLHPLAYDANLSAWASQNNAAQARRGLGHHVNPGAWQCSGWGYTSEAAAVAGWLGSPPHRAILFARATRAGIAYGPGPYWTLNAR